jgi:sugar lactone lactonase YvrE
MIAQPMAPSRDFGAVEVGTESSLVLRIGSAIPGVPSPSVRLAQGVDFRLAETVCDSGNDCSVEVIFAPKYPGLLHDALIIKRPSGVSTIYFHGVGIGPNLSVSPYVATTVAGAGAFGYYGDGAQANSANLRSPGRVVVDDRGVLYIADTGNHVIRSVSPEGIIRTLAGLGSPGYTGDLGPPERASLNGPVGIALDGAGNLYIADRGNNVIRKIDAVTDRIETVAGGGRTPSGSDGLGDGGPATNAILSSPSDVALDSSGNLYIADTLHGLIRKVDCTSGVISVIAGGGTAPGTDGLGDDGPAIEAHLTKPNGITLDRTGNIYIADSGQNLVRRLDAVSGIITVVAGDGLPGYDGDLGPATSASLAWPAAIATDAAGDLYIADTGNDSIRKVSVKSDIDTITVSNRITFSNPSGIALDSMGNMYVADAGNNVVRQLRSANIDSSGPARFANIGTAPLSLNAFREKQISGQEAPGSCQMISSLTPGSTCVMDAERPSRLPDVSCRRAEQAGSSNDRAKAPSEARRTPLSASSTRVDPALSQASAMSSNATDHGAFVGSPRLGSTPDPPPVQFANHALDFGTRVLGQSERRLLLLRNNTAVAINLFGVWISGRHSGDFTVSTGCGSVVAPRTSCYISILFLPQSRGLRTASLNLVSSLAPLQSIPLTGTGALEVP